MKFNKISTRLVTAIIALLLATLIAIAIPSYFVIIDESDKVLKTQMDQRVMCAWDVAEGLRLSSQNDTAAKEAFAKYVVSRMVGDNGYGYVIDSKGTVLYHPDSSLIASNLISKVPELQGMIDNVASFTQQKYGQSLVKRISYNFNETEKFSYYTYYQPWDMIIALSGNYNEFTQAKDKAMTVLLTVGIITLLASSILIYVIAKKITKPIEVLSDSMEQLRNGNLNIKKLNYKHKDELGKLADGFNSMITNISGMIAGIQFNSKNLEEQAENLSAVSEELSSSSTEVANAVQEVAVGASSQAAKLSEVGSGLTDFGNVIYNIVQKIGSVEQNSLTIGNMAKERSSQLTTIAEAIHSLNGLFSELSQKIINFGEDMKKINEVTDVIKSIADQTNLLALNAAIEAARAGESGRGFAVVAEEIRKLAEKSKESSSDISSLLEGLTQKSDNVANTTSSVKDQLFEHLDGIESSVGSFQEIIKSIENIIPEIQAINSSAASINSSKDDITSKIEDITAVSMENSASSEQIAASAQQMNASSEEVANSAQNLNEIAQKISAQLNRFKI